MFNTGYFMLPATPADLARFGLDLGTPVALGIPPDALSFTHAGALGALRATVVDVAALGSHSEVRLELCGGFVLTARVAGPVALRPGEACGVEIDLARCHCFDPGPFGQNLMPTTSSPAPGADRHA
ncbi:MAG: TOBE domain-containing protein [Phycisphaerae bacterium]